MVRVSQFIVGIENMIAELKVFHVDAFTEKNIVLEQTLHDVVVTDSKFEHR